MMHPRRVHVGRNAFEKLTLLVIAMKVDEGTLVYPFLYLPFTYYFFLENLFLKFETNELNEISPINFSLILEIPTIARK